MTRLKQALMGIALLAVLAAPRSAARATDLSGCWEGCWQSNSTGHKGVLRATFVRLDEGRYCAHFSGRFFKILPFRYSVVLSVIEAGDQVQLAGQSYLGRLAGGTYTYRATADACRFEACYSSRKDQGRFSLTRTAVCTR